MSVGWIVWLAISGEVWSGGTRRAYYALMLCDPDAPTCLPAAILYFSPLAAGLLNTTSALIFHLLALSAKPRTRKSLHIVVRIFVGVAILAGGAMYIQAAVSGANAALANTVLLFALAALVSMAALVAYTVGWAVVHAKMMNVPLLKRAYASLLNDWARALLVFGGCVPCVAFFAIATIKQRLRVLLWLRRGESETFDVRTSVRVVRSAWLTDAAGQLWGQVAVWAWTSVLSKAIWVGIFFMVMNVGFGKLTNVFVAWLIDALLRAQVGLGVVLGVVIAVGMVLFLIPPVPGFAVYLMASFLIPRFVPFWQGVALSIATSFGLKLTASLVQQKIIGQRMGGLTSVRALIGVNSTTTRAIRKLLATPGWGVGKVCILVGGPDWPTSVCCGILRLNAASMLLGTTPVLVVIAAVTVAGASQLRRSEGGVWASVSSMTLGIASAVMFVTLVASAYFIEDTAEKYRDELEKLPRDEEVDALERRKEEAARIFGAATAWARTRARSARPMPWWMRANLALGAALQIVACYAAQFFGSLCFAPFEMTDSIDEQLDGDWTNLFLPAGRVVILVWFVSCANLAVFRLWAQLRVRAYVRDSADDLAFKDVDQVRAMSTTTASAAQISESRP